MGRAVLFHGHDEALELVELPTPVPRGAEVLVRVTCCTLCSSDLHTHAGRREVATPTVLGHEIVGRIEALGPQADQTDPHGQPLRIGDRVSWSVVAACGTCFFCGEGLPQKCEQLYKYGHERTAAASAFTGGLADFVLLQPGTSLFPVPAELSDALAAPANCAIATAVAALRTGGDVRGRIVLVLGAGMLGLTVCALAQGAGAKAILVAEPDPERRERARSFGATHLLSEDLNDWPAQLAALSEGRGADLVFEMAGAAAAVAAALEMVRIGGTVLLAGTVLPTPPVALDPEQVVRRMLTLRGIHNYHPRDLQMALRFLAGPGRAFPFADLLGPDFTLPRVEDAFAYAHRTPGIRVAVVP